MRAPTAFARVQPPPLRIAETENSAQMTRRAARRTLQQVRRAGGAALGLTTGHLKLFHELRLGYLV